MDNNVNEMSLVSWWDEQHFPGKELFRMKDNGDVTLIPLGVYKERMIAQLSATNADSMLKALIDKFPEVETRIKELEAEWNASEDKVKLAGKVERAKEYLLHTNALGDFFTLLNLVSTWENELLSRSEESYKAKLHIVEQAEALVANDKWKETTQAFRDLAEQWRNIGNVSKEKNDELWARFEGARTGFFEHKRKHQEEQEREMMQNLDLKMELVEKAESLSNSEKWKDTTEVFKQIVDQWKAIGRTMHDKNEELWARLIAAKNNFFERKRVHFENIQTEREANYAVKLVLVERAEALKDSTDWVSTTQGYADIMEEWKKTGRIPTEKSDELWNRLNAAKDDFFNAKRQHQDVMKVALADNYAQKMALLKRAQSLKNSSHWHEATAELNEMMDEWKKIGPVPREHSQTIWEAFLEARKHFFGRKDENRDRRKKHIEQQASTRLHQARSFIYKIEEEIREEEERIADFKNGLENITPGRKEKELREHLTNLISQGEAKIEKKKQKLAEVQKELHDHENKTAKAEHPKAEAKHTDHQEPEQETVSDLQEEIKDAYAEANDSLPPTEE